jgi:hypothetical protein
MTALRGRYKATPDTVGDGQWTDVRVTDEGAMIVSTSLVAGDIAEIVPGVGATNLGKAEDAAHTTGDTGVAVWGVRNTTGATLAGTQLDYTPIAVGADGGVYGGGHSISRIVAEAQVKSGAGIVHTISISPLTATPTPGLLTVYDSLTETGTVLFSEWVFATTVGHTIVLDATFATGLYIGFDATLANVSITTTYR